RTCSGNTIGAFALHYRRPRFQNCGYNIDWKNAVRSLRYKRFDDHPVRMICGIRAVHQIYRALTIVYACMFVTSGKLELQAGKRFISRLDLRTFYGCIEIVVDRGAIYDAGDLISLVIVEKDVSVER